MTRILLALICICLVGCNTNVTKNGEYYINSNNPLKNETENKLLCTKIPNAPDKLLLEFYKYGYKLQKYKKNNYMTSEQARVHHAFKFAKIRARILSKHRKKITIDKTQAKEDIISINNQPNSYDIYNDTAMRKILNLPIHRAANAIRLLLKIDCELYK